jgi:hypothetical protein
MTTKHKCMAHDDTRLKTPKQLVAAFLRNEKVWYVSLHAIGLIVRHYTGQWFRHWNQYPGKGRWQKAPHNPAAFQNPHCKTRMPLVEVCGVWVQSRYYKSLLSIPKLEVRAAREALLFRFDGGDGLLMGVERIEETR